MRGYSKPKKDTSEKEKVEKEATTEKERVEKEDEALRL